MRVANAVHHSRRWLIDEIAPDFDLLDVWGLPVFGAAEDFDAFLAAFTSIDPAAPPSAASRFLFAVRLRLGAWLGWDDGAPRPIPGCEETTLLERVPADLRATTDGFPRISHAGRRAAGGFSPLYHTDDEAAAEISNATVHGILHLTWVDMGDGDFRAHLAVYVKPRGALGRIYMRFIDPFRHLVVYPALMRQIARAWEVQQRRPIAPGSASS